jgi:hypothetical protein
MLESVNAAVPASGVSAGACLASFRNVMETPSWKSFGPPVL